MMIDEVHESRFSDRIKFDKSQLVERIHHIMIFSSINRTDNHEENS